MDEDNLVPSFINVEEVVSDETEKVETASIDEVGELPIHEASEKVEAVEEVKSYTPKPKRRSTKNSSSASSYKPSVVEDKPKLNEFSGTDLRAGSKGLEVRKLQEKLGVKITSVYDDATVIAVRKYQKSKHLYNDGVVGKITWDSLFK